jgi:hypothetical protein
MALGIGLAVLLLGIGWHLLSTPPPSDEQERLELQARTQQLQRERAAAAAQQRLDDAWAPWVTGAWHLAEIAVLLAVPGGLAVATGVAWSRRRLPTRDGRLPRPARLDLETWLRTHAAWLTVRHTEAEHPPLPAGLTSYSVTDSRRVSGALRGEDALVEIVSPPPPAPPRFAELLSAGHIGHGRPLLYGYSSDGEVRHEGEEATSVLIAGQPRNGKSNTEASLAAQHALNGGQLVVCDPHAGNHRSLAMRLQALASAFLEPIADSPEAITAAVRRVHDELQDRKARGADWLRRRRAAERAPERLIALVIDEWTALLRGPAAGELQGMLADIVSEGQKYRVVALLAAQQWHAAQVGGTLVRNVVPTVIAHRCRGDDMRAVSCMRAEAIPEDTLALQPGEAYLLAPEHHLRRIRVPAVEGEDLARVGRLLPNARARVEGAGRTAGRRSEILPGGAEEPVEGLPEGTGIDRDAVVALLAEGLSVYAIAGRLGISGGRRYQALHRLVRDLREADAE